MAEKRSSQHPTIKMVAEEAGVSVGSVSNFLNHSARLRAATSKKIEEAIQTLDYSPDYVAGSLRRKKSKNIMVLSPNMNNTFHTKTLSTYTDIAVKHGYYIQTYGYEYSADRERSALKRARNSKSCLVVVFNGCDDEEEISRLVASGIPVILADRLSDELKVNMVAFDNDKVFDSILPLVKKKGYDRLGVFFEPVTIINLFRRYEGIKRAAKKAGVKCGEKELFCDKTLRLDNLRNGYLYMRSILEKNSYESLPKCWICSSDNLAIGALKAIREKKYRVPEDFSIIGFDNIAVSSFVNPQLTTVDQDQKLLGEKLWEMTEITLSGNIAGNKIIIPQKLILRESF